MIVLSQTDADDLAGKVPGSLTNAVEIVHRTIKVKNFVRRNKYRFNRKCSRRLQGLLNPLETWATYLDSLRCFMLRSESRKHTLTQHLSQNGVLIRHPRREDRPCRNALGRGSQRPLGII